MSVPTIPLRSAISLKVLKLSANPIRVLDEHSFVKMNTLTELYLDDMKELIEIKEKTFSYLYNLQKISISNLTSLDLRENPWTCDCHLLWAKYCHLRPELTHGIM
ncbi:unnamed protein product [Oppiella nova]|uniref:Uncharacterized protein n=1 Tax=Oppiella nova TaxID=334625 RepID=A0A7R9QTU5_9ACAR|nr:unnamed protein product [Oppiella nova]CAG2175430.1 unnamed protein product [Oppiella nova]